MDNRTIEEIRKNETLLIEEIKGLIEENQELKKQVEDFDNLVNKLEKTCDKGLKLSLEQKSTIENYKYKIEDLKIQQKEFIEWLEANLEGFKLCDKNFFLTNYKKEIKSYEVILQKYKEIVGE